MGTYNVLYSSMTCSRCGQTTEMAIQIYFGYLNLISYHIGDLVEWRPRKMVQNGGRPANGCLEADGYVVCPICDKDFWVKVMVLADHLTGVSIDYRGVPYCPDKCFYQKMQCIRCGQLAEMEIEVYVPYDKAVLMSLGLPGYINCPLCNETFFVNVYVQNDQIRQIVPNYTKLYHDPKY
jgi:transcription elongation factor Elf1